MKEIIQKRQLAAIMFTDIVGYTTLMGEDEDRAFALLKKNREIQKPLIKKFNGRWLKEIGDGVLASFTSVTDAVSCAQAIQEASKNEADLNLKIGIHQGEVVFEGEDVFGDGVNIASRLESLAPAGGIWVSESVSRNMQNKAGFASRFVREEQLKNVKNRVRIYEVLINGEASTTKKSFNLNRNIFIVTSVVSLILLAYFLYPLIFNQKVKKDISEVGVAIMPLRNISAREDIDFLSYALKDEIHEELALSKKFAFLSSSQATAAYKDKDATPQHIGEELGVDYILSGSYQISGDQLNVRVEFADTQTGNSVWTNNFIVTYEAANIFPIQADIAQKVLAIFNKTDNNKNRSIKNINLKAFSHYGKGNEFYFQGNWDKAIVEYNEAIALDSGYTAAFLGLVRVEGILIFYSLEDSVSAFQHMQKIVEYVNVNIQDSWETKLINGIYQFRGLRNYDKGLEYIIAALDENPESYLANSYAAEIYDRRLNYADGFKHIIKAININPGIAENWAELGHLYISNGETRLAIKAYKQAWSLNNLFANSLYKFSVWANVVNELPYEIKHKYPKVYASGMLAQEHKWNEILFFTDTVTVDDSYNLLNLYYDKCIAHFNNKTDDSSFLYARKYVELSNTNKMHANLISRNGALFQTTVIFGDSIATRIFDDGFLVYDGDEYQKCNYKNYEVASYLLQRKYDLATKVVISLESGCITYSIFDWLNTPVYHFVQTESPEFVNAVKNLPKPPPLSQSVETPALW